MIDFGELDGERSETMALLHRACEKWGCFQVMRMEFHPLNLSQGFNPRVINHGISIGNNIAIGDPVINWPISDHICRYLIINRSRKVLNRGVSIGNNIAMSQPLSDRIWQYLLKYRSQTFQNPNM